MMWLMMMLACASVKGRSNTPLHFGFNIPHHTTTQPNALCLAGEEIESNHWNISPILLAPIALRWNYDWDSKTTAFSFFLWWPAKQTGRTWSHKLLKFFHRDSGGKKLRYQSLKESYTFSLYSCLCVLKFRRTNDDSDKNVHFNSNIQEVVLGRYFSQCFRALLMLFQVVFQIRHDDTKRKEKITPLLVLLFIRFHTYYSQDYFSVWGFVICSPGDSNCIMIITFFMKCQDQNVLYLDWCLRMDIFRYKQLPIHISFVCQHIKTFIIIFIVKRALQLQTIQDP